jgi:hypothetical protein
LDAATNVLTLGVDSSNPEIWVELDDSIEPAFQGTLSKLFTAVLNALLPRVLSAAVGSIPLPVFDVGGLAGLPQIEVWELHNGAIERTEDHYRLTGSLD